jgi:DNA-binding GntR family transcriptional regulator
VDSNEQICEQMRLNNPGQIVYIERVRMIEEKPLFISQYYFPYDLVKSHSYPPSGELIEFFKAYHRADKMSFNVVLHQQT